MKEVYLILKEQFAHIGMIKRMSKYEEKATYQNHYLGLVWQILNPAIQIGIYYLVFGIGANSGKSIAGVPFICWMLIGIIPWFFINNSILGCSNSIYRQIGMVSKMKFPVSILPTVNMASNLVSYWPMMAILFFSFLVYQVPFSIYWLQYFYYFFCMIAFLFAFGILNSTITILIRDYHIALQSLLRLLFYISGPIWEITRFNGLILKILRLNPLYYIINGFRDSFIHQVWFWERGNATLLFWSITLTLLILGSHLHMKFRARFVDFV